MGNAARILGKLSVAIIMLFAASDAYAQDTIPVYGPRVFSTPTGSITNHIESFSLSLPPGATYALRIENGNPDGTARPDSVSIKLNGTSVAATTNLANQTAITVTVQASSSNTLEVVVGSSAGEFVRISLLRQQSPNVLVFGPKQYVRATGSPQAVVDQFTVPTGAKAPYQVFVVNGTEDGSGRFTNGTITLNGVEILENELQQPVGSASQNVSLQTTNTISVTLAGQPNEMLRIWITATDSTAPVLNVTAPSEGLITRDTLISVTGTVQFMSGTVVTVNGVTASLTNGSFSALVPANTDGQKTITVNATNAAGLSTTVVRHIIRDRSAPTITVSAPNDLFVSNTDSVVVSGTVVDTTAVTLNVNGVAFSLGQGGTFSGKIGLTTGANIITMTATDAAGNSTVVVRQVSYDASVPTLTVVAPADGLITKADSVSVSGTASDATALTVTVNGWPVTLDGAGAFIRKVALNNSTNTISVIADDAGGNRTTVTRTVTRDTIAPSLTVTGPANNTTVNADSVTISGSASDAHAFTVSVNAVPVAVSGAGTFSRAVALAEGPNTLTITARDTADNVRTSVLNITRLTLTIPVDPSTIATPINASVTTSIHEATAFLYTGANAIQTGVASGTIKALSVAVLRGRVLDKDGNALPGTEVTVAGRPEFGKTYSRADGRYDMAVNGGGVLVVNLSRAGYLPAQRHANTPWRDYLGIDDVRLVPLDTAATVISFVQPIEVARGSVASDVDGTRQATLMFRQGTTASLVMPGGNTQALSSVTVRATEYTVGAAGRQRMPASLPPTTAYTYAVEFSVDEAQQAGAKEVIFSNPVAVYVENFLDYTVGTGVPAAYYDGQKSAWVPSDDGRIVKVLSIQNGSAVLDVDGSGTAASSTALAALGITADELVRLATLYAAGQSLWRVAITHFSPWDLNWPYGPPAGATAPNGEDPGGNKNPCGDKTMFGSIIGCESQTLGEVVALTGTPFSLHYSSDRTPGYLEGYTIKIPLTGATVPPGLKEIELEVRVAGQIYTDTFPATGANMSTSYTWDGKDAYGRTLQGRQPIRIRTGFVYQAAVQVSGSGARSFAGFSGVPMQRRARQDVGLFKVWEGYIGPFDARGLGIGGWSISAHNTYDPSTRILYKGDGTWRAPSVMLPVINTVAGTGVSRTQANWNDGQPAVSVLMQKPLGIASGADGSFYFADVYPRVRSVNVNGVIGTLAGTGVTGFSGDGGPATAAQLSGPRGLAVGPDGSIYITDRGNHRIRRVAPNGIITTFAGSSSTGGFAGDGGPANLAKLNSPESVAVAPDGTVYITDHANRRIRRVAPDGIITTIAGNGTSAYVGDGIAAKNALIYAPYQIAVGPDGSVFFSDHRWIRRIGPDGIITTFAGDGTRFVFSGDGGPARSAKINDATGVAVAADGTVYIADTNNQRIRRVSTDGIITTIAGNGQVGQQGQNGVATQAQLNSPYALAVRPDGSVLIADHANDMVRAIGSALPGISTGEMIIASESGGSVDVLDTSGRHLRTLSALTGDTLLSFGYNAQGVVVTLTDADNNVTTVERDGTGIPIAIVGPYGQRTTLTLNANGFMQAVQNPKAEHFDFTYHTGGLLATFTDPRTNTYVFAYDSLGKLVRDDDPAGGFKTLTPFQIGAQRGVTYATAEGRKTKFSFERLSTRALRQVTVRPNALSEISVTAPNDSIHTTSPDGMISTTVRGADPQFGISLPLTTRATVRSPAGLLMTMSSGRKTVLSQAGNPFSVTSIVDSTIVNGRKFISVYNAAQRQFTSTSPVGRQSITRVDALGRLLEQQVGGITPVSYGYDAQGRIDTIAQGTRNVSFTYDLRGRRATTKDALGRIESYFYDDADRITRQVFANGREINFLYDAKGNLTSITPPSRPAHAFDHTAVDLTNSYTAPVLGVGEVPAKYTYNLDRQLTGILRPDSTTIAIAYDSAGRASTMTIPGATYRTFYSATTGNVDSLTARGVGLRFTYDGSLLKRMSWSGPVSGSVGVVYDNNFRIIKQEVNNADTVSFGYDNDGLLTSAGALSISRNAQNGLLTGTTLGSVATTQTYSLLGELNTFASSYASANLLQFEYGRDALGRITRLVETRGANRKLLEFAYDSTGQLMTLLTDSAVTTVYEYDANGNLIKETDGSGVVVGTVDAQDRLLTNGSTSFRYTRAGELKERTVAQDTTRYSYDAVGNLKTVTLPNGSVIEYTIDGGNRRIGKSVDGVIQKRWLYAGSRIVAEVDATGVVTSRFIYGSRGNSPDYMVKAGQTYRYVTDHVGSIRLVVNVASGVIAQEIAYDPYGDMLADTNPGFQPFGFAGGLYDEITELVRFGARDYDAASARWNSKDPIGFAGAQPNLYAYAGNDPINRIDPLGLCSSDDDEEKPCRVEDLVNIEVEAGLRMGVGLTVAGKGAYLGAEVGPIISIDPVSGTMSPRSSLGSVVGGVRLPFGIEGGIKCEVATGRCDPVGSGPAQNTSAGVERKLQRGKNGSSITLDLPIPSGHIELKIWEIIKKCLLRK